MKGYIYTMFQGADPGHGWTMNDPIFGPVPTLGACVPHIRRKVEVGDYIFAISGRVPNARQFVVGGFRVAEKINALAAYRRFPGNRLRREVGGVLTGNIIVRSDGSQSPYDYHNNFASRVENYIVGDDSAFLVTPEEYDIARGQTLDVLGGLFGRNGKRVFDIIGRHRRMEEKQVGQLLDWLRSVRQ